MNICIVTHSLIKGNGQGRVNYEVAQEVIRRGYSLTLVASEVSDELKEHQQVTWIPIPVKNLPTEFLKNIYFSVLSTFWLEHNKNHFDIIKVNGAITHSRSDVNAVHFVHSAWLQSSAHTFKIRSDLYGFYQWLYTSINAYWERQAFKKAEVIVAVSKKIAKEVSNAGIKRENIRVIQNGIDLQEFSPGPADRAMFSLPTEVPIALFAGDIQTPRKNLDTTLQALTQVPALHLAVAGQTDGSPYPDLSQQLGISDRVHFLGYCSDIATLMKAVDLLVFPSRYEPWGLVLVEAMASGLPVVTASTVGAAELVSEACGIVLSDPDDTEALAKALSKLANNAAERLAMGHAACEIVKSYGWEKMSGQYLDLFEEISSKDLTKKTLVVSKN